MSLSKFKQCKRKFYIITILALILSVQFMVPVPNVEQRDDVAQTLDAMGYEVADIEPASGAMSGRSLRFVVMEAIGLNSDDVHVEDDREFHAQDSEQTFNDTGWSRYRLEMSEDQRPAIAIVIDDVGIDRQRSLRSITALPSEVTLAFLPYADELDKQTRLARDFGHEVIVHFPMEPIGDSDPGPGALMNNMGVDQITQVTNQALSSFEGYAGVNNHMGSKVTQNRAVMGELMRQLSSRGLFYLDSRTINGSVAAKEARKAMVPYAVRDVFLDHENDEAFVRSALDEAVEVAKRKGFAIAIGHPKDVTIEMVGEWAETLDRKGVRLVPLSDVILYPSPNVAMSVGPIGASTVLEN